MATKEDNKHKRYRVLWWHPAGMEDVPCSISYHTPSGKQKTASTGDIVDDLPVASIGLPGQEDIRTFIVSVHVEEVSEE